MLVISCHLRINPSRVSRLGQTVPRCRPCRAPEAEQAPLTALRDRLRLGVRIGSLDTPPNFSSPSPDSHIVFDRAEGPSAVGFGSTEISGLHCTLPCPAVHTPDQTFRLTERGQVTHPPQVVQEHPWTQHTVCPGPWR
jgi:hypothetical protein